MFTGAPNLRLGGVITDPVSCYYLEISPDLDVTWPCNAVSLCHICNVLVTGSVRNSDALFVFVLTGTLRSPPDLLPRVGLSAAEMKGLYFSKTSTTQHNTQPHINMIAWT